MEQPPWTLILLATILCFFVTLLRWFSHGGRLPPGPRPWPVIGNLNLIGALPHRSIRELSVRYGPVMSLRLGSVRVVVASSAEAAKFFLKTQDLCFIDRPKIAAARYTLYNSLDMLWAPYGAHWLQARKLWQTELLSPRRLRSQEHARAEEVRAMLRDLHDEASSASSMLVTVKEHLLMLSINVISRMVLGKKYVLVDGGGDGCASSATSPAEFKWMIDELFFLNGALNVGDFVPCLSWMDPQGYVKRMKRLGKMFDRFLEHVLDEHDERRRREGEGFVPVDVVDQLLELADDPNLEVPIQRDGIKAFIMDFIAAATDPSAVVVEWALSELLREPGHLAKATEELDRVVGRHRLVTEADIPSLPYLDAIVKETMRLHPVAPLLAPHQARKATSFSGYDIPAGTRVIVNVWAIGRDPAVWDAPEEFRPERFLGSGMDVRGQDFELLPFGSGRRMCPGINLGLKMVQLSLANLLLGFSWRLPDGVSPEEVSMAEKYGLSVVRLVPLEAVAEPKLLAHLYARP